MANIQETNQWEKAIYEIATMDEVIGGAEGISNRQATQLAARTNFLKEHVSTLENRADNLESGKTAAGKATQLATARTIRLKGDVTGSTAFNGTADAEIILTHQDSGIKAGSYRQVTVDSKGRVTHGANPATLRDYGITDEIALEKWVLGLGYERGIQRAVDLASYANLPAGTRMPFAQAAAPTGWTQVNDDTTNNRMLRVVNGSGGTIGGVHDPFINNVVPAHTHTFTTGNNSADHTHAIHDPGHAHGISDPGHAHGVQVRSRNNTGSGIADSGDRVTYDSATNIAATGISIHGAGTGVWASGVTTNHTHSGATDNGSSQTNWQPRYVDLIICVKNERTPA